MRIVVLDGQSDPYAAKVTASIARALDVGAGPGAPASEDAARVDTAGGGSDRPSAGGGLVPRAGLADRPDLASEDDIVHAADAAVVLDPGSLARATDAGVALSVVVFPSFDLAWGGDLGAADRVIVAHERLVPEAVRRGAPRGAVEVSGPVAPLGYEVPVDRGALRLELVGDHHGPLVLVSAAAIAEHGAQAVMVQLALVEDGAGFLFDVGRDAEAADTIRRLAPLYDLGAWIFAEEPGCERYWQLADVVIGRARGYEVNRALAVGAPLVLLPPGRSDALAARTLEALGVGSDAEVLATLAVAVDRALREDALEDARHEIAALDMAGAASRIAVAVRGAWDSRAADGLRPRRGLPQGLEALPRDEQAPLASASVSANTDRPGRPLDRVDDLEGRIERELEALKRKLAAE